MATYTISEDRDQETGEFYGYAVAEDGLYADTFETREDAEGWIAEQIEEARNEKAREIFGNDLDALANEMQGWTREQIKAVKDAMIEGLLAARAMAK